MEEIKKWYIAYSYMDGEEERIGSVFAEGCSEEDAIENARSEHCEMKDIFDVYPA